MNVKDEIVHLGPNNTSEKALIKDITISGSTLTITRAQIVNKNGADVDDSYTVSLPTSSSKVLTVKREDSTSTHYITFVDSNNNSATNESIYTDSGIQYVPSTNTLTTGPVVIAATSAAESGSRCRLEFDSTSKCLKFIFD